MLPQILQLSGHSGLGRASSSDLGLTPAAARERLYDVVSTVEKGAFLVEGRTLVGKTWLLDQLDCHLEKIVRRPFVYRFVCSPSHAGYEPVLDAVESLSKRENWSTKKQAIFFGIKYSGAAVTFAGGILRRFFPDAIPKETLEQIRASLNSFSANQVNKGPTIEFPRSESSKICRVLNDVIKKAGRPLVLLVDRLEELPTPGIKLLQMLVDTGPTNMIFVASVSTDSSAYSSRRDIRELVSSFKRIGGVVYSLTGYSIEDLRSMRQFNEIQTSFEAAERAYVYSQGGIIGLVKDWLTSSDESNEVLAPAANQLVAHYSIQYDRLSHSAQNLVKCLGAIYPRGLSLATAAACLGCAVADVENTARSVIGTFAAISKLDLVLAGPHVLHFLVKEVGAAFVQAAYTDLSLMLGSNKHEQSLDAAVVSLHLNLMTIPRSVQAMDAATVLSEVREDLERGAHGSAMNRLKAWRAWSQRETTPDEEVDFFLLEADALGQVGAYREAIERLEQVPTESSREAEVLVSIGEKYWRAGTQDAALRHLATARRKAREEGRPDVWLKAAARTVAVKNEMSEGWPSARLAEMLVKICDQDLKISAHDRCHVYRTVARTFALVSTKSAIAEKYGRLALDVALDLTKSARDEGNARYALADVLRHQGKQSEAVVEYESALAISRDCGNYDLEVYSLLGIGACAIRQGNVSKLKSVLTDLLTICSDIESPEGKIIAIFKLSLCRLKGESLPFIDTSRSVSGRPWTTKLLMAVSLSKDALEAIQSATIVL